MFANLLMNEKGKEKPLTQHINSANFLCTEEKSGK